VKEGRKLAVLGVPSSAGAYAPGQEKAPAAFRRHGLLEALTQAGVLVRDLGDLDGSRWQPDPRRPHAANLPVVQRVAAATAERVAEALQGDEAVLGVTSELAGLGPRRPMLAPADLLYFGAHNITSDEDRILREEQMALISLAEVRQDPVAAAQRALAWAERYQRLLVHLDVDVLSFVDFPIAENVRRCEGLRLEELSAALLGLLSSPRWRALGST
jgi:arginase